ncbi:MAG: Rieske (2Fe-2S) protein [Erythrobacter sp.]
MMENAFDWEHLPFIHQSSFASIRLVEEGAWGWRCMVDLPNGGGEQAIELLVDLEQHYWATTVVSGFGQGAQIHTKARERDAGGIEVDVRFYAEFEPPTKEFAQAVLAGLQAQYTQLYDEDEALMTARQSALDLQKDLRETLLAKRVAKANLGKASGLDPSQSHSVELERQRFCVRQVDGEWTAHAAQCPHMLAPLADANIDAGQLTCPWHGYRFDLVSGTESQERCGALKFAQCDVNQNGDLIVSFA